jgi:hypothetical protein
MARELQAHRFLVLFILVSFFLLSSTIQARTLHAQTHHHHAIMKPTGNRGVTGYYITEVLGIWETNNYSDPILPRRDLAGPSPGDKH